MNLHTHRYLPSVEVHMRANTVSSLRSLMIAAVALAPSACGSDAAPVLKPHTFGASSGNNDDGSDGGSGGGSGGGGSRDAGARPDSGQPGATCGQLSTCGDCTTAPNCGFCGSTNTCVGGTISGPFSGTCSDWNYFS